MVVSFKGISNINVSKSVDTHDIPFWQEGLTKEVQILPRTTTKVYLKCKLSDDEDGNDKGDFYNAMNSSQTLCQNQDDADVVEIELNRHELTCEGQKLDAKTISLNGVKFNLDKAPDKKTLPLFAYMSKLSSKLAERDDVDSESKEALNDVRSITEKVIDEVI